MHVIEIPSDSPEPHLSTPTTQYDGADDLAASILSEAEVGAQAELRSTSEILKLAGCILRRGSSPGLSRMDTSLVLSAQPNPAVAGYLSRDHEGRSGISAPDLSIRTSLSFSPLGSPPSPTLDESIHLPGKFRSLSSAEVKKKLTSSPIKRTELLSKLDGLDGVVPSSSSLLSCSSIISSGSIVSCSSIDTRDELATKVARSSCDVSTAMENAHAHAHRIKSDNMASKRKQQRPRGISIGNDSSSLSGSNLSIASLAMGQSTRAQSPRTCQSNKMPLWIERKIAAETGKHNAPGGECQDFGQYELHSSETIITHEINRGDWSWATEWSPDGKYLALATENHGLAIVETGSSTLIWKVVHDERIGKVKNDTTHAIRSIAWGGTWIALGGTGDAVSIVEPILKDSKHYSFNIVNIIAETGFVGALSWLKNSNILAIGNREDQCLIAEIRRRDDGTISSSILHSIERNDWVTACAFSHGGSKLAVGDRSGMLSVYLFVMIRPGEAPALSPIQDMQLEDNILDITWSPDGKFLYTGGEDYSITILDTAKYSILHRIGRDCWVNFLAPSHEGSYLAAGGGTSRVSLLDVKTKWEEVTSLPVLGGIALSAKWHPKDEYLAVCGQYNDVVVYESSCQRLPKGKCLRSKSSILAVEFSPDGKMIAVGNETGLITFFDVLPQSFVIVYQTVIGVGGDMAIKWNPNGECVAISSGSTFVLLNSTHPGKVGTHPQSSARFLVRKVIQSGTFSSLAFSPNGQFLALSADQTRILDLNGGCACVRVLDQGNFTVEQSNAVSSAWSDDCSVFAMVGDRSAVLSIFDVNSSSPESWELLFSISFKSITSLCWGPSVKKGLQYLAFGGGNETVTILEVRTHRKVTAHNQWESVLEIPCNSIINDLGWNDKGMLCIGDDDGIVSVVDLSYLKSGKAVSEMNYNWQRSGIISTTKMTRNFGRNAITSLCWLPSSTDQIAIGGSDGIFEIVDL